MSIQPIDKAVRSEMNSFELQDVTEGITRKSSVKTGLLTSLLLGNMDEISVSNDKVAFDELTETVQLPEGKRFDELGGGRISKDHAKEKLFRTGSYGISANVAPSDVAGKRKPFSNDLYTVAERVNEMSRKMDRSWEDFRELSIAKILTTDTNYAFNGAAAVYDFYDDIYGASRPTAADIAVGTADVEKRINDEVDKLMEDCSKAGVTYTSLAMPCSGDLYDKLFAYEKTLVTGVAGIDYSTTLDLRILAGDRGGFSADEAVFNRRNFTSSLTGVTYIRMDDSIGGISLMNGTNKGYLIPVGAENMFATVYSPSQDMDYVNTMGMKKYAFMEEHKRRGITLFQECNALYMNRNAKLVRHIVSSN